MILGNAENEQEREELKRMLTTEAPTRRVTPDDDEWRPPGWGSDEQVTKEAEAFTAWSRNLKPKT